MAYTKLFSSILDSTVWETPLSARVVWITMLAMSDRFGEVAASVPGLAKRAGVTRSECERALALFMSPDPDSRSRESEGRRIEEVDGGWRLINFAKYMDKQSPDDVREKTAERVRRHREREKEREAREAATRLASVTLGNVTVTPETLGNDSNDTRPDQTILDETKPDEREDAAPLALTPPSKPKRTKAAAKTALPAEWQPGATQAAYAKAEVVDLDHEAAAFRLSSVSNGRVYVNHDAAFGLWLRNTVKWRSERGGNTRPGGAQAPQSSNPKARRWMNPPPPGYQESEPT